LDASTYSLINYNEAEKVVSDYNELAKKAQEINNQLKPEYKDAFYQLILYPFLASTNLNELYVAAAKNKLYASQGRASTNEYADKVKELFKKDAELTNFYHTKMASGKWNHMMSQTHIGYTNWQQPDKNVAPETKTVSLNDISEMGIAVEGSENWWPNTKEEAVLPTFSSFENMASYIDVFNRGTKPFAFKIVSKSDWITFSKTKGTIDKQERIAVEINWKKAPQGTHSTFITVLGAGKEIPVAIKLNNPKTDNVKGFVENNGYIVMEAGHFSNKYEPESFKWKVVENLGKTSDAVISLPIKKGRVELNGNSPKLSYNVHFQNAGTVKVHMYFSPTINYSTREDMFYGLSFDNNSPLKINYASDPYIFDYNGKVPKNWDKNVTNNIKIITTEFDIDKAGNHTLKYFRVDEGLVLQKIIIETEKSELKTSNLGPAESSKK